MIRLILANKPKYIDSLVFALNRLGGNPELLKQPNIAWFLLADEIDMVGVAYVYTLSDVRMHINILLADYKHKDRKQAGTDLLVYLKEQGAGSKLETLIPTDDSQKLGYFSQIGFKREGVSRASILVNDTLGDQVHMGHVL